MGLVITRLKKQELSVGQSQTIADKAGQLLVSWYKLETTVSTGKVSHRVYDCETLSSFLINPTRDM